MTKPEPPDDAEVEYLTPGQVARILHVSPKTVDRWADQGRIGCIVTLGGHRRFARGDVDEVVAAMTSRSSARRGTSHQT
ncbi:MAG TPA: helix-turn-helix domain-containing protein [Acidimicrobiales bacterium]|jgi:excisionase family DNA binding protein|nr:helix-turn-helix domain-containing protein [Acidimicrobiales bacterium]